MSSLRSMIAVGIQCFKIALRENQPILLSVRLARLVLGRSQTLGFGCLWHSGPPLCPAAEPGAAGPHLLAGLGARWREDSPSQTTPSGIGLDWGRNVASDEYEPGGRCGVVGA